MIKYVIDTHALLWFLGDPSRISPRVQAILKNQVPMSVGVSAISLCEIVYLIDKKRIDERALDVVLAACSKGRFTVLPVDEAVATSMVHVPRAGVPDLPDRIIVATSLTHGAPLITKDQMITNAYANVIW